MGCDMMTHANPRGRGAVGRRSGASCFRANPYLLMNNERLLSRIGACCLATPLLALSACGGGSVTQVPTVESPATKSGAASTRAENQPTGPSNTQLATNTTVDTGRGRSTNTAKVNTSTGPSASTSTSAQTSVTTSTTSSLPTLSSTTPSSSSSSSSSGESSSTTDQSTGQDPQNLLATVVADPEFSVFVELIKMVGLEPLFTGSNPYTVFAPTNAAFEALPEVDFELLKMDKNKLKDVLLGHLVASTVKLSTVAQGWSKRESQAVAPKTTLLFERTGEKVKVGGAQLIRADLLATNGVVHKIDKVLLAPKKNVMEILEERGDELGTLTYAMNMNGLDDQFRGEGPFTFFAPTNAAIAALGDKTPAGEGLTRAVLFHAAKMLKYSFEFTNGEVLQTLLPKQQRTMSVDPNSGSLKLGDAPVVVANIQATNGVVYIVSKAQLPKP